MKSIPFLNKIVFFIVVLFVFSSCSDDSTEPKEEVNYELKSSLTAFEIKLALKLMGLTDIEKSIKYGVDIYTYKYPMEYLGNSITASGLISVPKKAGEEFPVMSFQHGTMVEKLEAPSVNYASPEMQAIAAIAGAGYVVSIPDFVGFGTSEEYFHPFLHKQSNVYATISMLEEMKTLANGELSGVSFTNDLYLAGYSQGGWVTLGVLEEFENSNTLVHNWNIQATVCGAGPYNLETVMQYAMSVEEYEQPYFMPYGLLSFIETGYEIGDLSLYFSEPYASDIPNLYNGINSGDQINAGLTFISDDLFTSDFQENYSDEKFDVIRNALQENSIIAWACQTPLLLVHGDADTYIPIQTSIEIEEKFSSFNSNVSFETLPGVDHMTAAMPCVGLAFDFFENLEK